MKDAKRDDNTPIAASVRGSVHVRLGQWRKNASQVQNVSPTLALMSMHPCETESPVVGQTPSETWTPLCMNVTNRKVLT